jgi:hypothetical protein
MTSSSRLAAGLLFLLAASFVASVALAQGASPTPQELETARSLYKQGKELRAAGDVVGALEKFEAAHSLGNTPVTGIELARTYVQVGRLVEAREVCLRIGRTPVASDETEKSASARTEAARMAAELEPRIATLIVRVAGLGPGETARVAIDGKQLADGAIDQRQRVDPGTHAIVVQAGEGASARERRATEELSDGETREVSLSLPPVVVAVSPPPPPRPAPPETAPTPANEKRMPVLATMGFALAAAGGAIGLIAGVVALDDRGQLNTVCNGMKQCGPEMGGGGTLDSADTWATASTVSFVVAGAGLGLGIGVLLGQNHDRPAQHGALTLTPWVGAGTAGMYGRF